MFAIFLNAVTNLVILILSIWVKRVGVLFLGGIVKIVLCYQVNVRFRVVLVAVA